MFGFPNVTGLYQHPYLDSLTLLPESHHIHNVLHLVPGNGSKIIMEWYNVICTFIKLTSIAGVTNAVTS